MCAALHPPDDGWLCIAEIFAFLTSEQVTARNRHG
jgi:hypothetical protein